MSGPGNRAGSTPDLGRMRAAVAGPGIDTRVWADLAYITALDADPQGGVFAEVILTSFGETDTVRVGVPYAGSGWGAWNPLAVDDEVLVVFPFASPDLGGVIVARLHSPADVPPPEAIDGQDPSPNVVLRVQPGKKYVLRTSGDAGDVDVKVEGTGNVRLVVAAGSKVFVGDDQGSEPIALGQTLLTWLQSLQSQINQHVTAFNAHVHATAAVGPPSPPTPVPTLIPEAPLTAPPDVRAAKGQVK